MARKRRGHGEGGVYQRESDGKWVGSITVGRTAAGKQKRRVVYGKTKAEALAKLRELQSQQLGGTLADPSTLTVEQFLKRWTETVGKTKRGTTQDRRRVYIEEHINPHIGGVRLNKLGLVHLEGWLADLEKAGASAWTRNQAASMLKTALKHAVRLNLIGRNPADLLVKPRVEAKEVEVFTEDEANRLLATSAPHRLHALYVLALTSGMRQGELLGLHWPAVDFEKGTVTILRTLKAKKGGGFVLEEPKSKKSRRTIELPQVALEALHEHRKRMLAEGRDVKAGPVFVTRTGNFIGKSNFVKQIHKPMLKRTGLRECKFHVLRHTHASTLLARGRSLRAVSERLGHSSPELTLRVYAHLMPGDGKETARLLDEMFGAYAVRGMRQTSQEVDGGGENTNRPGLATV
jgi:integrase